MNNRQFADLIPVLLFAATTFVVVAFCVHQSFTHRRRAETHLGTIRREPYRDTDAAEGACLEMFLETLRSGLYGIGAIGALVCGGLVTWIAWHGVVIDDQARAVQAQITALQTDLRQAGEQDQRRKEDIAMLIRDVASLRAGKDPSSATSPDVHGKACLIHVELKKKSGLRFEGIAVGNIGLHETGISLGQADFPPDRLDHGVPVTQMPQAGSISIRIISRGDDFVSIRNVRRLALNCEGTEIPLIEYGTASQGRPLQIGTWNDTAVAYPLPLPPSPARPRGFVLSAAHFSIPHHPVHPPPGLPGSNGWTRSDAIFRPSGPRIRTR